MCLCVFHLITREERNSESSFLEVGGDWGYWIFTQWGFSKHTVLCWGEAAFLLFQFQLFFALAFQWVFCFLLLMEHTFCLIFFLFLLHARQKRIHFCKVFPWVWILFLLFFCNFLGRDEPFNVFNCCNDLLHQVILLVFF